MKKNILTLIILLSYLPTHSQNNNSISLGPGYTNQSFFSFENGETGNVNNENWDLAFSTGPMSATIRVNAGKGAELYSYIAGDTSHWNIINSSSANNTSSALYNSTSNWGTGAFNLYEDGMYDLGWGTYSMITHHVTGDSLFIIRTINGQLKKLWIEKLASGIYYFTHANLDGSNEINQTINKNNYPDKEFVYYSLDNNSIEDREPNKNNWDISFTKYIALDMSMPYSVTGVLHNYNIEVAEASPVQDPFNYTDYLAHNFESNISTIGYDWKYYDFSQGYVLDNNLCYFVKNTINNNIYRVVFTEFEGTSSGNISFNTELINTTSFTDENNHNTLFSVYPNPASSFTNIIIDTRSNGQLYVHDLTGKKLSQSDVTGGLKTYEINLLSLKK